MKRNAATRRAEGRTLAAYREWAAPLAYCLATGASECQMAHIRHYTGAGLKPPPQHVLPLCQAVHSVQETRRDFWPAIGIDNPQHEAAELFAIWNDHRNAEWWSARLAALHQQVDRDAVELILRRVA